MKNIAIKMLSTFASLAFIIATIAPGTASYWALHEPEMPEALRR